MYKLGSPIGEVLSAAHALPSEANLRRLRELAKPASKVAEAGENLAAIRTLLTDATLALEDYLEEDGTR